jgi:hypothetical protein
MTKIIRLKSGEVYSGETSLEIVEQMRQADFDPPPTVREYIVRAVARAASYFNVTLHVDPENGTEAELAERFVSQAIARGLAQEGDIS